MYGVPPRGHLQGQTRDNSSTRFITLKRNKYNNVFLYNICRIYMSYHELANALYVHEEVDETEDEPYSSKFIYFLLLLLFPFYPFSLSFHFMRSIIHSGNPQRACRSTWVYFRNLGFLAWLLYKGSGLLWQSYVVCV